MAKNLDSIKKLDPEEVKKNRKIVLNYIGEKDAELTKEPGEKNLTAALSNRVDGLRLNKTAKRPAPEKISFVKEMAGQEKKEIAQRAKFEAEKKIKAERDRQRREKFKLEEKLKEEKRIARENECLMEIKQAEEIARVREEVKSAKLKVAAKRKIKRQKALRLLKKNLLYKLEKIFVVIKKNLAYAVLYLIIFLIIGYAIFCLLVLRFKIDNNMIRRIARVLPVPAAITNQGIINYNDWRDFNLVNKKSSLAGWLILRNLRDKYGLPVNSPDKILAIAFYGLTKLVRG